MPVSIGAGGLRFGCLTRWINVMFRPKKGTNANTFLQTKRRGHDGQAHNDYGANIGKRVKV